MANTVIALKKSSTPSSIPSSLEFGELAINYADGKLYYKNTNSQIAEISGGEINYFGTVNANSVLIIADTPGDILTLEAGDNITIVGDAVNDKIIISAVPGGAADVGPAFTQANTARDQANAAFTQANTAGTDAVNAFGKANTAGTDAINAFGQANTARTHANAAFGQANTAQTTGVAAFGKANTAGTDAVNAFDKANTAGTDAINAFGQANTARDTANTAQTTGVAAFGKANTSLANTSGVSFNGNLFFPTGNVGIGLTAPTSNLHVIGTANITSALTVSSIELGHASDTTLARSSAGNITIEGNVVYRAGGTDVPVTDGGTGASDAGTARTNLGLAIGTNVQAYNDGLAAIAGLAVTDSNFIVGNGTTWVAESGATARTSLGLGTMATQASGSVSITGGSITGITDLAVTDGGTGASNTTQARTNLDVPSRTGSGASGSWEISVTGSAAQLGGVAASSYMRTDSGQTITGRHTFTSSQSGSLVSATGGIGGLELQATGSGAGSGAAFACYHRPGAFAAYFGLDTDNQFACGGWSFGAALGNMKVGSFGVGTAASGTAGEIRATNNITAYYSDKRLKTILRTIPNALEKLKSLSGIIFKNNDVAEKYGYTDTKEQVGVIAQEVEAVLPQVVVPAPFDIGQNDDGTEYSISGENYKTVQYEKLVPLLIEAIKEQQTTIEQMQNDINMLRDQVKERK